MKIFLITVLLTFHSTHCYVVSNGEEKSTSPEPLSLEKDPEDMNKILDDIPKTVFGDDTELIKDIAEEIDEEMSDSPKESLQDMKENFLAALLRLHAGGELYKDAKREALLSAFKEISEDVDQSFITELRQKLQQKERQRGQKIKEYEINGLKTQSSDQSFENK